MRLAWLSIPIIAAVVTTHLYGEELLTEQPRAGARAPEFTHQGKDDWINSAPLSLSSLRGRVLLVDFWTFDCWNCYRSFPWLNAVHEMFASRNLQIVGVHSPEFRHERACAHQRTIRQLVGGVAGFEPACQRFETVSANGTLYCQVAGTALDDPLFDRTTWNCIEIQARRGFAKAAERVSLRPPAIQQRFERLQVRATLQFGVQRIHMVVPVAGQGQQMPNRVSVAEVRAAYQLVERWQSRRKL